MKMQLLFLAPFLLYQAVVASDTFSLKLAEYRKDFGIMAASRDGSSFFFKYQPADEDALVREMRKKLYGNGGCKRFFSRLAGSLSDKKDKGEKEDDGFVEIAAQVIDQAKLDYLKDLVKRSKHLREQAEVTQEIRRRRYLTAAVRFFGCGRLCCLKSNFSPKKQR